MDWLNYHHLLYFWLTVRSGSVTRAAKDLHLTPSAVSIQIRALEEQTGHRLLVRSGRQLVPTEMGRNVYRYADEIFALGQELQDVIRGSAGAGTLPLVVGIVDVIPKMIVHWLIEPGRRVDKTGRLVIREAALEHLLPRLAMQEFDLLLTDAPLPAGVKIRAYSHFLGDSPTVFMAVPGIAGRYRRGFPHSLNGAPLLLPADNTAVRKALDEWFDSLGIRPSVAVECEDYALLREFARTGGGILPEPAIAETYLHRHYRLQTVGRTDAMKGRLYAITPERTLKHPVIAAICETARQRLRRGSASVG